MAFSFSEPSARRRMRERVMTLRYFENPWSRRLEARSLSETTKNGVAHGPESDSPLTDVRGSEDGSDDIFGRSFGRRPEPGIG
jgi:hypothetical protein